MKSRFEFNQRKVWEFVETNPFGNTYSSPQYSLANEIFESKIENDPEMLQKYAEFEGSGINESHPYEILVIERRESYNRLRSNTVDETFPSFLDIKYAESSKIFEAEEIKGATPDQILEAEEIYEKIIEKIENGEEIDEGFLSGIAGGAIGALAGPAIGRAICKVLGIDTKGTLGKLLTSRLVTAALGYTIGK